MSLSAAVVRELVRAGLKGDALSAACERIEDADRARTTAERVRAHRARKQAETTSDVTDNVTDVTTNVTSPSLAKKVSPDPFQETQPTLQKETLKGFQKGSPKPDLDTEFEETFWPRWPHKVAKLPARKSFAKARKHHSLPTIMAGLERYIRTKPPERDWQNPTTFLNQERFNDEPASPNAAASPDEQFDWNDTEAVRVLREKHGIRRGNGQGHGKEPVADDQPEGQSSPMGGVVSLFPDGLRQVAGGLERG